MVQQIEIEGYTRTGFRVVVRDTVSKSEDMKRVMESIGFMRLLPERPAHPDKIEYGRISHVALTHTEDGTPHVAFFHENARLEKRWTHKYLNSETEREAFEAWSGLNLASMQQMDGNTLPQRGKAAQARYIIALPEVRAINRLTRYKLVTEDGKEDWKGSNDVESYIMPKSVDKKQDNTADKSLDKKAEPPATVHWSKDESQIELVVGWIAEAKKHKPQWYELAEKNVAPMTNFGRRVDYLAALSQIAANEEKKASSDDIPF